MGREIGGLWLTWYKNPSAAPWTTLITPFWPAQPEGTVMLRSQKLPRPVWLMAGSRAVQFPFVAVWSRVARKSQVAMG